MNKNYKNFLQTKQLKSFDFASESNIGCVREENQDAEGHFFGINGELFIVCDGMGGTDLGKIAAEIAVETISSIIMMEWIDNPTELIEKALRKANQRIYNYSLKVGKTAGTTVALMLVRNVKVWYAHVGDSRIYYRSGERFFALTTDHSVVQKMVDDNLITPEEALTHPKRNIVTKALGLEFSVEADISSEPLLPADNDIVLLCSDGLTNELDNEELEEILKMEDSTDSKVEELISKAVFFGAHDNVTVQIIHFFNTSKRKEEVITYDKRKTVYNRNLILLALIMSFSGFFYWFWYNDFSFSNSGNEEHNEYNSFMTYIIYPESNIQHDKEKIRLEFTAGPEDCIILYRDLFELTEKEIIEFNRLKRNYLRPGDDVFIPKEKQE